MKKLLISAILLAATASAIGATTYSTNSAGPPVSWETGMRVMRFGDNSHGFSPDGFVLVCRSPNVGDYSSRCLNPEGGNAWQHLESAVPAGFRIQGINIQSRGSSRELFVYLVPVR